MSKGIAIQTILLLLVGVIVVGIIVYLVYLYTKNPVLGQIQCMGVATSWCTSCKLSNFGRTNCPGTGCGPKAPTELGTSAPDTGCGKLYWTAPTNWDDCWHGDNVERFCKECCGIS
jgi:hypothetical protein